MNLYDFNDLSDLPEALSARLSTSAVANPNVAVYADIIAKASEAGLKVLSITQIEAVAVRMGLTVKSQQTIRTALNSGVKAGLLVKPTRQSYAIAEKGVVGESTEQPVDVTDETTPAANGIDHDVPTLPVATAADAQIDPLA